MFFLCIITISQILLNTYGRQMNTDGTHNLQIQANKQATITSVKKIAPRTVAGPVHAATDANAETIRQALQNAKLI